MFLCLALAFGLTSNSAAQIRHNTPVPLHQQSEHEHGRCASTEWADELKKKQPNWEKQESQMNLLMKMAQQAGGSQTENFYIPVVVHVITDVSETGISDEQIIQGIQDLNDAFANAGAYYDSESADTHIRFCLAQQDPVGLPTTGINRRTSYLSTVYMESQDELLKAEIQWDSHLYLNIWLVTEIYSSSLGANVAGYATLPYMHGTALDGIVNEARWFGSSTDNSKVHIHEAGHFLGLYHTFQGGCSNGDCTSDGDLVCDTPPDASTDSGICSVLTNSCTSDEDDASTNNPFRAVALGGLGDQPDMIENYMDYSSQSCQHQFTEGQIWRMQTAISGPRYSLATSNGCFGSCGIGEVRIQGSAFEAIVGEPYQVNQSTFAAVPVQYSWCVNNEVVSTDSVFSYTFPPSDAGLTYLVLKVTNQTGECERLDSVLVRVRCDISSAFTRTPEFAEIGESIVFTSSTNNAFAYQWILDGEFVSQSSTFAINYDEAGGHRMKLIVSTAFCSDTSQVSYFNVGSCISGRNNTWVFGYGSGTKLSFNDVSPSSSLIPNDDTNDALTTIEGLSTISDANGNLLLYSDGNKIWNRFHDVIFEMNGAGGSSAQGVQIVPDPGNANQYYVFTAENFGGELAPTFRGFSYVLIDVTVNNGAGGPVSSYNQIMSPVCERQTSIRHCNGHDIWVICQYHPGHQFYAFLITDAGIQSPVVSSVYGEPSPFGSPYALGSMKARPQGDLLAVASYYGGGLDFLHFDNETGEISSQVFGGDFSSFYNPYGLEFSPDGSKLYGINDYDNRIFQYDLSSNNLTTILASAQVIGVSSRPYYSGSLELGPDGKIYHARMGSNALDVIHRPNEFGVACQFEDAGLPVVSGSIYGLQTLMKSDEYARELHIMGATNVCVGQSDVRYSVNCGNQSWDYRGGNSFTQISDKEVSLDFVSSGVDTLICFRTDACLGVVSDTVVIYVSTFDFNLGSDFSLCASGYQTIHGPSGFSNYVWSTGATNNSITVSSPGTYWLRVLAEGGCSARDTLVVTEFSSAFDVPTSNVYACYGNTSFWLKPTLGDYEVHWYEPNGPTMDSLPIATYNYFPLYYEVFYRNAAGCVDRDTITVSLYQQLSVLDLPESYYLCDGQVQEINIDSELYPNSVFRWPGGIESYDYTVYQNENYMSYFMVEQRDTVCGFVDYEYVQVFWVNEDLIQLPDTVRMCEGQVYNLYSGGNFPALTWQDGTTGGSYTVTEEGLYSVSGEAACGTFSDSTRVLYFDADGFQLNLPDTLMACQHQLPTYISSTNPNLYNYTYSNNNWGFVYGEESVIVTAQYQCGTVGDTVFVKVEPSAQNTLPNNLSLCDGENGTTLELPENQQTIWGSGEVSSSLEVTETGVYSFTTSIGNECSISAYVNVVFDSLSLVLPDTTICEGGSLLYLPQTNVGNWMWIGPLIPENNMIADTGYYAIYAWRGACFKVDDFRVDFAESSTHELTLVDSISVCVEELPVPVQVQSNGAVSYSWSNGSEEPQSYLYDMGWYEVSVSFACGSERDSVWLEVKESPSLDLPEQAELCLGSFIELLAPPSDNYLWSTGDTTESTLIADTGWVWLQVRSGADCLATDSILVSPSELYLNLPDSVRWCVPGSTALLAETNANSALWSNGYQGLQTVVSSSGVLSLVATLNGCSLTDSVYVELIPRPLFTLGADTLVNGASLLLEGPYDQSTYWWDSLQSSSQSVEVNESGVYQLTVTNESGCAYTDSIRVVFYTISSDSFIDVPGVFSAESGLVATYNNVVVKDVKIFDARGRLVSYSNSFPMLWQGRENGGLAASAVYFYVINYTDGLGLSQVKMGKSLLVK